MTSKFYLPSKIISYLKRLQIEYGRSENDLYSEVIRSARVYVREGTSYDNWNGGTHGHDVLFFLPPSVLAKIELRTQDEHSQALREDLNRCAQAVENEFINDVSFEHEDENDSEFQKSVSVAGRVQVNPDALTIWKPGQIRLFISHRDTHKAEAKALAIALEGYGISAFVAHDTIAPMTTWQAEILKGLETMEIMLAFVTDDFHDSTWTNQEVGFALGRNVPVISLKLQKRDPTGFIGNLQALKGRLDNSIESAPEIYKLLSEKLGNRERLQGALISAFVASPNFTETIVRFDRLVGVVMQLSEEEVAEIIRGFADNDQLHNCIYLDNKNHRLRNFLKQSTDRDFVISGRLIAPTAEEGDDDIPC